MVTLRHLEYYINSRKKGLLVTLRKLFYTRRLLKLRLLTGMNIEPNTIGPGVYIPYGNVVMTPLAKVGSDCTIESGVTLGITNGIYQGPQVGNRVFIGTGAKIIGQIVIADGVCIGANAVVVKSVLEENVTVAGVPAKKVSNHGSATMTAAATEQVTPPEG